MRFRIRDLISGKTVLEANRGRDIVHHRFSNYRPGLDEWIVQFFNEKTGTWQDVPARVRKEWMARYEEEKAAAGG